MIQRLDHIISGVLRVGPVLGPCWGGQHHDEWNDDSDHSRMMAG